MTCHARAMLPPLKPMEAAQAPLLLVPAAANDAVCASLVQETLVSLSMDGGALRAPATRPRRGRLLPILLSLALHLLPVMLLALPHAASEPLGAGEEVMAVEMVIAEEATPSAIADEASADEKALAPSPAAAQSAKITPDERLNPDEEQGEVVDKADPKTLPEKTLPEKAETTTIAVASAPPPPAAEAQHAAASAAYHAKLARHLARFKRFPSGVKHAASAGQVVVSFAIDSAGGVIAASIQRSSGIPAFDQEALAMIYRAAPFPPPPETAVTRFTIPVSYRLRG